MGSNGLSALVKFLLMIPKLILQGLGKILEAPGSMFVRLLGDLTKLPKFIYLAFRSAFRKFL